MVTVEMPVGFEKLRPCDSPFLEKGVAGCLVQKPKRTRVVTSAPAMDRIHRDCALFVIESARNHRLAVLVPHKRRGGRIESTVVGGRFRDNLRHLCLEFANIFTSFDRKRNYACGPTAARSHTNPDAIRSGECPKLTHVVCRFDMGIASIGENLSLPFAAAKECKRHVNFATFP